MRPVWPLQRRLAGGHAGESRCGGRHLSPDCRTLDPRGAPQALALSELDHAQGIIPSFLERACPVLDLYERVRKQQLEPTESVFSIDEKTSIQARHHATYRPSGQGEPAHVEHTYQRKGAVNLIAALNVVSGVLFGQVFPHRSFVEFSSFIMALLKNALENGARRIHLILDNGSIHRPKYLATWLAKVSRRGGRGSLAARSILVAQPNQIFSAFLSDWC